MLTEIVLNLSECLKDIESFRHSKTQTKINMNTTENLERKNLLERAQNDFLRAWEKADGGSLSPNLPEIALRYPQVALELTEWATEFVALENIVEANTEKHQTPEMEDATERGIERAKAALRSQPSTLSEAINIFDFTPATLAQKSRMAPGMVSQLCEGGLTDWPAELPDILAEALPIPAYRIPSLLTNSAPVAHHYSATGDPTAQEYGTTTFRQAIEDALEDGEISEEDARFWLDKLSAEGK